METHPAHTPLPGSRSQGMTLNTLKYIAAAAMTIDHIAFAFVPDGTAAAVIMHFIGKTAGPVMFFSAVEGCRHTRDIRRYTLRLAAFAAISWFPFLYFRSGGALSGSSLMRPNVIYTILMGVLAIRIRHSQRLKCPAVKGLLLLALVVLCVPADWGTTGIIILITFDYFYGDFGHQAFAYCLIVLLDMGVLSILTRPFFGLFYEHTFSIDVEYSLYLLENAGAFIPLLLLSRYRGAHGVRDGLPKWFFYLFYPLHLLVLGYMQLLLS